MYIKSNKPAPQKSKLLKIFVTILIVDQEETMRIVLGRTLKREGFSTLQADSGVEALELIREKDVDLLITDSIVSDMSGLELLDRIKGDFPKLPVLLIIGRDQDTVKASALEKGAMDFISKPFNNTEVLAALRRTAQKMKTS